MPPPVLSKFSTYRDIAWEEDSTREWICNRLAVETAAVGSQPQNKQLALVFRLAKYDLDG